MPCRSHDPINPLTSHCIELDRSLSNNLRVQTRSRLNSFYHRWGCTRMSCMHACVLRSAGCVCVCVWCPTDRPVDLLRSPSLLTPVVERSDHLLIRTCFFLAVKHVFIMSWFEQLDGFCKLTERVVPCGDDEHDAEWLRGDPSCRREREQPGGDLEQEQVSDTVTSS